MTQLVTAGVSEGVKLFILADTLISQRVHNSEYFTVTVPTHNIPHTLYYHTVI